MMGGALGGARSACSCPHEGAGFWPLVSMGAILGGTMRSPFTGVIFALELTHDVKMLLPLLVAVAAAHAFTVLVLKRSILTEKVARRGYHLSREYAIDPLEILFVREVMRTSLAGAPDRRADGEAGGAGARRPAGGPQRLYPVVDAGGALLGVVTRFDLHQLTERGHRPAATLDGTPPRTPVVAHPDEPLRVIAIAWRPRA